MRHKTKLTYSPTGDHVVLTDWVRKRGMTQKRFIQFLEQRGLMITPQTCSALVTGKITPGPMFRRIFREITGIALEAGFIETR